MLALGFAILVEGEFERLRPRGHACAHPIFETVYPRMYAQTYSGRYPAYVVLHGARASLEFERVEPTCASRTEQASARRANAMTRFRGGYQRDNVSGGKCGARDGSADA